MAEKITFFDLPSREGTCWSLNPWKTRMLLNFKSLDYETKWVEYPDVKPTLEPHVKPNESGWAYTIPTIRFPDGTYVMDSKKIAEEIEAKHPSPSLHLDSGYQPRMEQLVGPLVNTLFGVFIAELPKQVLNPRSVEYWNDDRANIVGMPVEQHEREHGGQKAIENGAESLRKITGLYKEETAGPFLTGETPIYADFVWVSFLVFMKRANPAWWGSLLEATGDSALHEGLIKASEPWLKRNDH